MAESSMQDDVNAPPDYAAGDLKITVKFHGKRHGFNLSRDARFSDLTDLCRVGLPDGDTYDWSKSKFLRGARTLKAGKDDAEFLGQVDGAEFMAMVPKISDLEQLKESARLAEATRSRDAARRATRGSPGHPTAAKTQTRTQDDLKYSFMRIEPLQYLPNPERSRQYLVKLSEDPGIRSAMRKHKFSVGLLTEMNPIEHTTSNHEGTSRTLGLNRNAGEVIELRLRTDAYDGYRDYKTIRKTLCHELAHNVFGPHDRNFWDLCHQIEKEVDAGDWKHGGRSVGNEEYYEPLPGVGEEDVAHDHGGWTGGQYILGGTSGSSGNEGLSRREVLAKAAEERAKRSKMKEPDRSSNNGGSS